MTRAFITGRKICRKILKQHSALLEKQKTRKYKYLRTGNRYQLQIALLVVCPQELILNASFSQKIKKKFSGP
jgi:hypothetical protein